MMGYKYKRKTAEEKKAEIEQLTKQLEEGVEEYLQSDRYRELLLVVRSVEPWKNCAFSVMLAEPFAVPLVNTVPPGA